MAGSILSSESDLNLDPDRIIELTEVPSALGVKDQPTLDSASLEAEDDINERLSGTYVVPFTAGNVPGPIRRIHAARWRYLLFEHRDTLSIPQVVADEWKAADAKLDDYATPGGGRVLTGAQLISMATPQSTAGGSFSSDADDTGPVCRVFGRYKDRLG